MFNVNLTVIQFFTIRWWYYKGEKGLTEILNYGCRLKINSS